MIDTLQRGVAKIRLGATSDALTFAVACVLGLAAIQSTQAQTFTVLHSFHDSEGARPFARLVRDVKGNLFGTTAGGGTHGVGTVFKVSKTGKETVLYTFCSRSGCTDGENPFAGLVPDTAGNFYGTTDSGGSTGKGTVFKVDTTGTETVLHSFTGSDGENPEGGLLSDKAGNLYGTTLSCDSCYGTVYQLSKKGRLTVLHRFAGEPTDGEYPQYTSLLMDTKGNLYGVTELGGTSNQGVVYKLSRRGTFTVLHNFAGGTRDGCGPLGTPAMDKDGNLYGTAQACGSFGYGIVWRVSKTGTETVLHNFAGYPTDGANPWAGVTMDAKGNFYGDTERGGTHGYGTVWKLSKADTLTVLHSFARSDGENPIRGFLRDAKGDLYGTAYQGGSGGSGTVWKLAPK